MANKHKVANISKEISSQLILSHTLCVCMTGYMCDEFNISTLRLRSDSLSSTFCII